MNYADIYSLILRRKMTELTVAWIIVILYTSVFLIWGFWYDILKFIGVLKKSFKKKKELKEEEENFIIIGNPGLYNLKKYLDKLKKEKTND